MHCGPPNQNFAWAIAHQAHRAWFHLRFSGGLLDRRFKLYISEVTANTLSYYSKCISLPSFPFFTKTTAYKLGL